MPPATFSTPESAALDGFPSAHCRVVASAADGDDAYVLLDTRPAGAPYLYGVCVARTDGGWVEGSSGNGDGWTMTDGERGVGTATAWETAPEGADRVRVAFGGDVREVAVENGVYLAAWWRVPYPDDLPRAVGFRVGGRWIPA
ncbi:hypothetical protein, partial [Longimicrobium sp.]|uniref:hypothetical protein n=1 Tax=Longimicrobium sp. TaxID=2029185 RepID=UPI002E31FF64